MTKTIAMRKNTSIYLFLESYYHFSTGKNMSFLSREGILGKRKKKWHLNSLLCSFCKGDYKMVQTKLSLCATVSAIQITGEQFSEKWAGSYFHQGKMLLICLPKKPKLSPQFAKE